MSAVVVPQEVAALGYQQLEMRKRIALQMMAQRAAKSYPKNVGQGLTAASDSIGDVGMMQAMQRQQQEYEAQRQRMLDEQQASRPVVGM